MPLVAPVMGYEPARDMFLDRIPMARAATPEEIAAPCLYLASDDASFVTGHVLMVVLSGFRRQLRAMTIGD